MQEERTLCDLTTGWPAHLDGGNRFPCAMNERPPAGKGAGHREPLGGHAVAGVAYLLPRHHHRVHGRAVS